MCTYNLSKGVRIWDQGFCSNSDRSFNCSQNFKSNIAGWKQKGCTIKQKMNDTGDKYFEHSENSSLGDGEVNSRLARRWSFSWWKWCEQYVSHRRYIRQTELARAKCGDCPMPPIRIWTWLGKQWEASQVSHIRESKMSINWSRKTNRHSFTVWRRRGENQRDQIGGNFTM